MTAPNFFAKVPYVASDGPSDMACVACGNVTGNSWVLVENPRSTDAADRFRYNCCSQCGTLSLDNPRQADALYNDSYYSFTETSRSKLEGIATKLRNRYELTGSGLTGKLLARMWDGPRHRSLRPLLSGQFGKAFARSSKILDVGCGAGDWLRELRDEGFSSLAGCDPFLELDDDQRGITLRKGNPSRFDQKFDIITAHHSFEHAPNGEELLRQIATLLSNNGIFVIRIPVAASYGWRRYGGNWVQLDPPFHAHLYSVAGMTAIARRAGLEVVEIVHDSTHFMVTGSEAQIAGLRSHTNQLNNKRLPQKVFGRAYANRVAAFCNLLGSGDQAAFYLQRRQDGI